MNPHETERAANDDMLVRAEMKARSIIEGSPWGMHFYALRADGELVFESANPSADKILGIRHSEFVGLTIEEAFPSLKGKDIPEIYTKVARTGQPWHSEQVLYKDDRVQGAFEVYAFQTAPDQMVASFLDITDRKNAEEEAKRLFADVQQERDRLSSLVNSMSDEVWLADVNKRFLLANASALKEFGLNSSDDVDVEGLATSLDVYLPDGSLRPLEEAPPLRSLRGEIVRNQEEIVRTPGTGEVHYRLVSSAPIHGADGEITGSVSVVRDITDLRNAEENIRGARKAAEVERSRLSAILEAIPVGISVADGSGHTVIRNKKVGEILGESSPLANSSNDPGHNIAFRSGTDVRLALEDMPMYRAIRKGETVINEEIEWQHSNGRRVPIIVSCVPIRDESGAITSGVAAIVDITRQKEVERELARSNTELQSFAYAASHDLREPLRTISGFLELLQMDYGDKLDDNAREYISRSVDASVRLHDMIEDILLYSKLDTRKRSFAEVDLNVVAKSALRNLDNTIKGNNAEVVVDLLPTVWGDKDQLEILLRNLIENGIKFRRDESPKIHVSGMQVDDDWLLSVKDNGIGIAQSDYGRVFTMFVRLLPRRAFPGTGIGLAACRKIVERHGGRIWVESKVGQGSVFHFTMPRRDTDSKLC